FVGHRHCHLAASGERLQEGPLCSGQILEAVGEDGLAAPGIELAGNPVGGVPPKQVAVPEVEPIELGAVPGVEPGELAFEIIRIEQSRLELAHRREQGVCEAAEASRAAEPVERLSGERAPDDQRLLRLGRDLSALAPATRDALEEIVESDDRAAEESRLNLEQLTLALFDVRPVRHDEIRL